MPVQHRFEILRHIQDRRMEAWTNPSGDVLLVRHKNQQRWSAFLHHVGVIDAELLNGGADTTQSVSLTAKDPHMLARRLAAQENVHVVLDGF